MPKPFTPPEEYFSSRPINVQLQQVASIVQQGATQEYRRRFGLARLEWSIVVAVGYAGGLTMTTLASKTGRQPSQVSRAVNVLVERNLLSRTTGATDRRELRVVLTPEGQKLREALEVVVAARNQRLTEGVTPEEVEIASAVLTRIRRNALAMLDDDALEESER